MYNGHNRPHFMKFQAVTTTAVHILHFHGTVKGKLHDYTFYMRRNFYDVLPENLEVNSTKYEIYGDSGYIGR